MTKALINEAISYDTQYIYILTDDVSNVHYLRMALDLNADRIHYYINELI